VREARSEQDRVEEMMTIVKGGNEVGGRAQERRERGLNSEGVRVGRGKVTWFGRQ
jgi:hypothetical protein